MIAIEPLDEPGATAATADRAAALARLGDAPAAEATSAARLAVTVQLTDEPGAEGATT